MTPVRLDIVMSSKRVAYVGTIGVPGLDLSLDAWRLQARPQPGQIGPAVLQLASAGLGAEGIAAAYDPALYDPMTRALTGGTVLTIQFAAATLSGLSWMGTPPDEVLTLAYDLLRTPPGDVERVFSAGNLIIYPGVTI